LDDCILMRKLVTIYLSAALFFGIFLVSQPIVLTYLNCKNYSSIYLENNSLPAEENTEKTEKEFAAIHNTSLFDVSNLTEITKNELFLRNERCGHLFTPSILVPPPEEFV
jgi:hypothetical protein